MFVWHLYLIKPVIGALLGFILALLLKFGVFPFLVESPEREAYGILIVAGFAGIFAERATEFFSGLFRRHDKGDAGMRDEPSAGGGA